MGGFGGAVSQRLDHVIHGTLTGATCQRVCLSGVLTVLDDIQVETAQLLRTEQQHFLTDTRGTGVLNRAFHGWTPFKGEIPGRRAGVLISMEDGVSVAYALFNLEERGRLFIGAQEQVYQGMVIGEHSRDNDLEVNPLKGKKLTNVRASGKDDAVVLTPATRFSLEEAIAYIDDDELVEVTPNAVRLRKRHLDPHERKRAARAG